MSTFRKTILAHSTRLLDLFVLIFTLVVSIYIHAFQGSIPSFINLLNTEIKIIDFLVFFVILLIWNRIFKYFNLYQVRRLDDRLREWVDIFKAVTGCALILSIFGFFFYDAQIDRHILITFWGLSLLAIIFSRTLVRAVLVYLRQRGRNLRNVVFVGSGPRAIELAQKIMRHTELGYRLLGFVDDEFIVSDKYIPRALRLGKLHQFPQYIESHVVDEVFIALPIKSYYEEIRAIMELCREVGISCRLQSDWFEFKNIRTYSYTLDDVPLSAIHFTQNDHSDILWLKRGIDIGIAVLALILTFPFMLLMALLVKLSSPGPVFFKQVRIGYNKRRFTMYKFRTMIDGAEKMQVDLEHLNELEGPVFKMKDDPRITPIGKWMRRLSIDELPQFVNILKGDMSLVGPRPLPLRDARGIAERWQKRRYSMRPGMTCLWQINGRNRVTFSEWVKLDLEYIDNWSLALDLKILWKTFPAIIKATGQ